MGSFRDSPSVTIPIGDRPALEVALALLTFLADTYGAEVESADVRSATEGTFTVSFRLTGGLSLVACQLIQRPESGSASMEGSVSVASDSLETSPRVRLD